MSTARAVALKILARWTEPSDPPAIPERDAPEWQALPPRDRALAFELVTGVLRWRGMLDGVIASQLKQPLEQLELPVRAILWLGAYQLLLLSGVRTYAAVDTSVRLTREAGVARAGGLVNAVLRNITRLGGVVEVRQALTAHSFPRDFTTQISFRRDVYPQPTADVVAHLAVVLSHPRELVAALRQWYGEDDAVHVMLHNNQRPVVTLRVDTPLSAEPMTAAGLGPHESAGYCLAQQGWTPALEALIASGVVSPQDPTAGAVVRKLATLAPGGRVLDMCAGLGTKTIQLSRALPGATITADDIDRSKLQRLAARAQQIGAKNIELDRGQPAAFDAVLVDAPCSNTGVMCRRVQSRWRWPRLDLAALLQTQRGLLETARGRLAPGGLLAYATCSIDPRENSELIAGFRAAHPELTLVAEELILPSFADDARQTRDGGYFAVLR